MKAQEQFATMVKDNMETALLVYTISMGSSGKLGELISDFGARCMADSNENLRIMATGGDLRAAAQQWPNLYQVQVARFLETSRRFLEVSAQTQTELCKVMDARAQAIGQGFAEAAKELSRAAEQADALATVRAIGERTTTTDTHSRQPRRVREAA